MNPQDYEAFYRSAQLTTDPFKRRQLERICKVALANHTLYKLVENETGVFWALVAAIHYRESGQSFKCHLHNGDPLSARTVHVPMGRPLLGSPPFTWTASAIDALSEEWKPSAWDLAGCLEFLERYNGLGYQKHGVMSPYLWDFTSLYQKGLFTSDGVFDPEKVESRAGCVAILKTLTEEGVSLAFSGLGVRPEGLH